MQCTGSPVPQMWFMFSKFRISRLAPSTNAMLHHRLSRKWVDTVVQIWEEIRRPSTTSSGAYLGVVRRSYRHVDDTHTAGPHLTDWFEGHYIQVGSASSVFFHFKCDSKSRPPWVNTILIFINISYVILLSFNSIKNKVFNDNISLIQICDII